VPKSPVAISVPVDLHDLVSFEDPTEDRTWVFDLTFLESNWTCIFGSGCKGVYAEDATELSEGCCSHGAHLVDKADRENLKAHASRLRADQWQHIEIGERKSITKKNDDGVHVTRVVDGACIFLNRPDFHLGAGCALHVAAVEAGERPLDWKPEVCWQLPLRRLDDVDPNGHVTSTIREWKRRDWGDGGAEFHWWCTEATDAFRDQRSVWQTMGDELTEMIGEETYEVLAGHLTKRAAARPVVSSEPTQAAKAGATKVAITRKPRK
jgi:hypothetical protein